MFAFVVYIQIDVAAQHINLIGADLIMRTLCRTAICADGCDAHLMHVGLNTVLCIFWIVGNKMALLSL